MASSVNVTSSWANPRPAAPVPATERVTLSIGSISPFTSKYLKPANKRSPPQGTGYSEQRQLAVLVELPVARALSLDVVADHPLVPVSADGAGEIAVGPELAAPQPLSHVGAASEDLARRQALDDRHQLGHAVGRHRPHQKMDMILVRADLQKLQLVTGLDL